ncbi:MAG: hypothetical protein HFJ59_01305 [Clostridia bacterium]|nr:hypothetical protein [Clostridia bacterium]
MKVLFAVSNEEISESIVKRYQKDYKEIISYKNVYYFNAILKELQKDKNYDRIVIGEELEAFTNTQYSQIDKFIFDKLDSISDEATNLKGDDIPIILICSDRRGKSEEMLVKLFGIGIYDALLGNDRSVDNVCKLLNKPRVKKEAKLYYKIDSEDVSYQAESENDVSEIEIQNILAHYKRLGKDEQRYVDSFDNIASQYNDIQLRIISGFLPLNVRVVLEERSQKYQQIISYNSKVSDNLRNQNTKEKKDGTTEKLLGENNTKKTMSKPVVIPSSVNVNSTKKMAKVQNDIKPLNDDDTTDDDEVFDEEEMEKEALINQIETLEKELAEEPPKRKRGRPRKNPLPEENAEEKPKRGRGRPRKNPLPVENSLDTLNTTQDEIEEEKDIFSEFNFQEDEEEDFVLPGMTSIDEEEENILPGFDFEEDDDEEDEDIILPGFNEPEIQSQTQIPSYTPRETALKSTGQVYQDVDISNLLASNKKVACFVGTSKNGTSFIVNNLAEMTSSIGIDTAILDTTKNRNSYYIYTRNEEDLRKIAMESINNLSKGQAQGIQANKNLTVYTSLPDETDEIENVGKILQTLLQRHSLVLIDCDFDTPMQYFEKAQEIYLVQTYDILTIQPLTAFLRDLKSKNILQESKLRIVLNKALKVRGVNDKTIIGGMAYYNDPTMSFMTELFNKNTIRYITVPFNEDVYTKYLENIIECEMTLKGYPKNMVQIFNELAHIVFPMMSGKRICTT